jgi:hypothetical protein
MIEMARIRNGIRDTMARASTPRMASRTPRWFRPTAIARATMPQIHHVM